MRLGYRQLLILLVVPSATWACSLLPVQGESAGSSSTSSLVEAVRKAKVIKAEFPIKVSVDDSAAVVNTVRSANQPDNDCKIDAVLMGKAIMEASKTVTRVKVLFAHEDNDSIDTVTVTEGEIKAFGDGSLSEKALLSSLEIVRKEDEPATKEPQVRPGPYEIRRAFALTRISVLSKHGTDVEPFRKLFVDMEKSVASGLPIKPKLDYLDQKLREQEDLLRQASKVQSERTGSYWSPSDRPAPRPRRTRKPNTQGTTPTTP